MYLQPSRDLAVIAADCLAHHDRSGGIGALVTDAAFRYALRGIATEADLLSYLYFDRCYAEHLIELGQMDARAHADELVAFFSDEAPAAAAAGVAVPTT